MQTAEIIKKKLKKLKEMQKMLNLAEQRIKVIAKNQKNKIKSANFKPNKLKLVQKS